MYKEDRVQIYRYGQVYSGEHKAEENNRTDLTGERKRLEVIVNRQGEIKIVKNEV